MLHQLPSGTLIASSSQRSIRTLSPKQAKSGSPVQVETWEDLLALNTREPIQVLSPKKV